MGLCRSVQKPEIENFANSINEGVRKHDMQAVQSIMDEVNAVGCNAPRDTFNKLNDSGKDAVNLHHATNNYLPSGKADTDALIFGPQS